LAQVMQVAWTAIAVEIVANNGHWFSMASKAIDMFANLWDIPAGKLADIMAYKKASIVSSFAEVKSTIADKVAKFAGRMSGYTARGVLKLGKGVFKLLAGIGGMIHRWSTPRR